MKTEIIRKTVNVSDLKQGDTVEINGEMITVSKNYLKNDPFMGHTFMGQPFRNGITKVTFKVPILNGFRYE